MFNQYVQMRTTNDNISILPHIISIKFGLNNRDLYVDKASKKVNNNTEYDVIKMTCFPTSIGLFKDITTCVSLGFASSFNGCYVIIFVVRLIISLIQ